MFVRITDLEYSRKHTKNPFVNEKFCLNVFQIPYNTCELLSLEQGNIHSNNSNKYLHQIITL